VGASVVVVVLGRIGREVEVGAAVVVVVGEVAVPVVGGEVVATGLLQAAVTRASKSNPPKRLTPPG